MFCKKKSKSIQILFFKNIFQKNFVWVGLIKGKFIVKQKKIFAETPTNFKIRDHQK